MSEQNLPKKLNKGDITRFFFRWWCVAEIGHSYERMVSVGLCTAMAPILKKLYPTKEKLSAALKRHLAYFNSEGIWGTAVMGIAISMEEEISQKNDVTDEEAFDSINGIKTGFMGPLAGIGDTIDFGTISIFLLSIAMALAKGGSWLGGVVPLLFTVITIIEGLLICNLGYSIGKNAIAKIFNGNKMNLLIEGTSIVGMMMMGALGSSYVSLSFASKAAQKAVDSIIPGLLPLTVIFIIYYIISKKTQKISRISLGLIGVSLLMALTSIF